MTGVQTCALPIFLITHTHADHISGLQTLLKRCAAPVFTTERAARELSWRLPGAETRLDALDFGIPQSIGEFAVTAFPTSHDAPGSCGFRLGVRDENGREASELQAQLPQSGSDAAAGNARIQQNIALPAGEQQRVPGGTACQRMYGGQKTYLFR